MTYKSPIGEKCFLHSNFLCFSVPTYLEGNIYFAKHLKKCSKNAFLTGYILKGLFTYQEREETIMVEKLQIVDADTLLSTPMRRTRFIIDGLLPEGITILCGAPKIGKSWLMLRVCLQVSQGLDVWGMKTRKCEVLYLCLEDSFNRLQDRLYSIADEYGIAIVVVHHLRKQADDNDPFNQISGTTGITGAVDTAFLITKDNRNDEVALLTATGRDIEQQRLILRFLKKVWTLEDHKGQAELRDEIIPQVVFKLVDFIKEQGKWEGTATELVAALGEEEKMVQTINRIINRFYYEVLAPNDIAYSTKRCANKRLIQLTNNDTIDSNDEE